MTSNPIALDLLARNKEYSKTHQAAPTLAVLGKSGVKPPHTFVYCCMDGRVDPVAALGLKPGEAVVHRNVGGDPSRNIDDLLIVDQLVSFKQVVIITHQDCGLTVHTDDEFREKLRSSLPDAHAEDIDAVHLGTFKDIHAQARKSAEFLRSHPLIRKDLAENIVSLVYSIETGELTAV
ncbi:carbonic anhydrase [Xylariomycetidae sp. FL2044]|nr:carbonic anhydrase [Xylariomycetidae sp. FL2044]